MPVRLACHRPVRATPTLASRHRPEPVVPSARKPVDQPDRSSVLARLRTLYAEALEYPEDVLTEDALLEAELGIDSLKQTALLTKVAAEFELGNSTMNEWAAQAHARVNEELRTADPSALKRKKKR